MPNRGHNSQIEPGRPILEALRGHRMDVAFAQRQVRFSATRPRHARGSKRTAITQLHRAHARTGGEHLRQASLRPSVTVAGSGCRRAAALPGLIIGIHQDAVMQHPGWAAPWGWILLPGKPPTVSLSSESSVGRSSELTWPPCEQAETPTRHDHGDHADGDQARQCRLFHEARSRPRGVAPVPSTASSSHLLGVLDGLTGSFFGAVIDPSGRPAETRP